MSAKFVILALTKKICNMVRFLLKCFIFPGVLIAATVEACMQRAEASPLGDWAATLLFWALILSLILNLSS